MPNTSREAARAAVQAWLRQHETRASGIARRDKAPITWRRDENDDEPHDDAGKHEAAIELPKQWSNDADVLYWECRCGARLEKPLGDTGDLREAHLVALVLGLAERCALEGNQPLTVPITAEELTVCVERALAAGDGGTDGPTA